MFGIMPLTRIAAQSDLSPAGRGEGLPVQHGADQQGRQGAERDQEMR
jgi:hypothetical protein